MPQTLQDHLKKLKDIIRKKQIDSKTSAQLSFHAIYFSMSVELEEYVSKIRIFLEPLWLKAHEAWADEPVPNPPSKYMCRYACLFLQRALKDTGYGHWHIFLGRPATPQLQGTENGIFGYRSTDGKWYDHAWLIKDNILIDITADQYGDTPVIVADSASSNYNANMSEDDAKDDLQKLLKRVNSWLQEWEEKSSKH